jgi:large subunit ribosomal protein L3
MGHRKKHAPKRGSLAYLPRGRAPRSTGRVRHWPEVEEGPVPLGFAAYKAGMTYALVIDDTPGSMNFGKEVVNSVTLLDAPPMLICSVRAYKRDTVGLKTFTEVWAEKLPKDFGRIPGIKENPDLEEGLKKIEENLDRIVGFRVIAATQPRLTRVPKKKPDLMEIKIGGGAIEEQFEYLKKILGKTISAKEIFKEGQLLDVIAVTKGKGFQGPVKRWGVRILQHKARKTKRGIATLGAWHPPRVLYTVPRAGQMGYHQRTEYNKRILKIGENGSEVTPKGGFLRYGPSRGEYILIRGSVPGPAKRLIRLRYPARPPKTMPEGAPEMTYLSLESQQGK